LPAEISPVLVPIVARGGDAQPIVQAGNQDGEFRLGDIVLGNIEPDFGSRGSEEH